MLLLFYVLVELFEEVGLLNGVLNIIFGFGFMVGEVIVKNDYVVFIIFIGSLKVGIGIK